MRVVAVFLTELSPSGFGSGKFHMRGLGKRKNRLAAQSHCQGFSRAQNVILGVVALGDPCFSALAMDVNVFLSSQVAEKCECPRFPAPHSPKEPCRIFDPCSEHAPMVLSPACFVQVHKRIFTGITDRLFFICNGCISRKLSLYFRSCPV